MNAATMKVDECQCTESCEWYTPVADFRGMEIVVDMFRARLDPYRKLKEF